RQGCHPCYHHKVLHFPSPTSTKFVPWGIMNEISKKSFQSKQTDQYRSLYVESILCLTPHYGLFSIYDIGCYFLTSFCRQTVHENCIIFCVTHEFSVYLIF